MKTVDSYYVNLRRVILWMLKLNKNVAKGIEIVINMDGSDDEGCEEAVGLHNYNGKMLDQMEISLTEQSLGLRKKLFLGEVVSKKKKLPPDEVLGEINSHNLPHHRLKLLCVGIIRPRSRDKWASKAHYRSN